MNSNKTSFSDLSDTIYNIKEKLTDSEFMELMNQLKSFKKEEELKESNENNTLYKFTILYPFISQEIESCHCHPYKFHSQSHTISIKKLSFISKMVSCKNSKMNRDDYCSCCSRESDHCVRINSIKNTLKHESNSFLRNIHFESLIKIVDENCKQILNELKFNLNRNSLVESIEVIQDNDDDEEDEEEENNKSKIKQVIRHRINFDIEIFLDSIEKIDP